MKIYLSDARKLNIGFREKWYLSFFTEDELYDFNGVLLWKSTEQNEIIEIFLINNDSPPGKWEILKTLSNLESVTFGSSRCLK